MNSLEIEPCQVINALTTIFLRRVTIIGSNSDALQPWTAREKVLYRHALVLGQCLNDALRFLQVEQVLRNTFVG